MRTLVGIGKGMALGAGNVLAVGWGVGALRVLDYRYGGEIAGFIIDIGMGPGLVVGAGLGAVGARLGANRRVVMVLTALAAMVALGAVLEPRLIPFAAVPTTALALVLERWTRSHLAAPVARPLASGVKGAIVGVGNLIATVAAFGAEQMLSPPSSSDYGPHGLALAVQLLGAGVFPSALVAACAGWILEAMSPFRTSVRLAVIVPVALGGVTLLGTLARVPQLVLPAALVAAASALVLERWTRKPPDDVAVMRVVRVTPPVPPASPMVPMLPRD